MPNNTTRQSARAALREQQELQAKQARNRKVLGWVVGAVALLIVGLLAVLVTTTVISNNKEKEAVTGAQLTPTDLSDNAYFANRDVTIVDGAPTLRIYEDFQCPICATAEGYYGDAIEELADSGQIKLEYVILSFLDEGLKNDSSQRAAEGAAAADLVGKVAEYHGVVMANQPQEGVGFTDAQLRDEFPAQAGITGADLTKFQEAYDNRSFHDFVAGANDLMQAEGVTGTPTFKVNGNVIQLVANDGNNNIVPTVGTDAASLLAALKSQG